MHGRGLDPDSEEGGDEVRSRQYTLPLGYGQYFTGAPGWHSCWNDAVCPSSSLSTLYNFFLRNPQGIKQGFIYSEMIWNQHRKILQKPNNLSR